MQLLLKYWKSLGRSGIDLTQNVYLAQEMDAENLKSSFTAVLLPIASVESFQQMLSDIDFEFEPVSQGYGYLSQGSKAMMVWNEEVAILGIAQSEIDLKGKLETYIQPATGNSVATNNNLQETFVN